MITTHINAVRVQKARATAGKLGFAKAVQRYIKRTAAAQAEHLYIAFKSFPAPVVRKPKPEVKREALDTTQLGLNAPSMSGSTPQE